VAGEYAQTERNPIAERWTVGDAVRGGITPESLNEVHLEYCSEMLAGRPSRTLLRK